MDPIQPKNNDMHFDRTAGQTGLESSTNHADARQLRDDSSHASLVTLTAVCAVHGCCDGDWASEEGDRWDGLS